MLKYYTRKTIIETIIYSKLGKLQNKYHKLDY